MIQHGTPFEPTFTTFGRVTVCEISKMGLVVGTGAAIRHPQDKDNPKVGRMVALARALDEVASLSRLSAKRMVRRNTRG